MSLAPNATVLAHPVTVADERKRHSPVVDVTWTPLLLTTLPNRSPIAMSLFSRRLSFIALAASGLAAHHAEGQSPRAPSTASPQTWRLSVTIFRSPGTGVQLSRGSLAVFAAHYPTIFDRGEGGDSRHRPTTHFLRFGVARYLRANEGTSPYVSLSVAPSLTRGWSTSGLLDIGVRRRFTGTLSGQLGAAVLHTPDRHVTRLNPTLGLGVSF